MINKLKQLRRLFVGRDAALRRHRPRRAGGTFAVNGSINLCRAIVLQIFAAITALSTFASDGTIQIDDSRKQVTLADGQGDLVLRLNYNGRCNLDQVIVRGHQVAADSGVFTGIRQNGKWFTSRDGAAPIVSARKDTLSVSGITFGPLGNETHETWQFTVEPDQVIWHINRKYPTDSLLEDAAFPEWDFSGLSTWTGGLLDNGGVVLDKYLENANSTYGAHFGTVTFWNSQADNCLRIIPRLPNGQFGAGRFSQQTNGVMSFNYVVSDETARPKHSLIRFLGNRQDVWRPFHVKRSEVNVEFTLKTLDYASTYSRGNLSGLGGSKVGELLNTVARYGVIDQRLVGGNGWRSGYICLHEPFFAEMGLALDENDYITNFAQCLDYERDNAITADGRVKSRWCHTSGDAMHSTYDDSTGFYEARWGYLLDSQPDYVINVAEEFDLTGDRKWLEGEKATCEKALDYLMRREVGHSGLVAMMNNSLKEKKSSDWIDVVWASYENAFVNAALYEALNLWAAEEDTLGDPGHAATYRDFAERLKTSFNRPIADGGFWDPTNQWYIYWRDKDGSIHGNNLVPPVNFAAIAYGICDDAGRRTAILDRMEHEMQKEQLFSWPLCFFPYQPDEGGGSPFPSYENGDIFLSWNELGVRSYAALNPNLALKYVKNTLARYDEDGLSYQRYLRKSQQGAGDDILAGNCMAIVGLYRDIYGIQPRPNRLYLDPHLPAELSGTEFQYQLRGSSYRIELTTNDYAVTVANCTLRDTNSFGINAGNHKLEYFPRASATWAMAISRSDNAPLSVKIDSWFDDPISLREWTESAPQPNGKTFHRFGQLCPGASYALEINGKPGPVLHADNTGHANYTYTDGYAVPVQFMLFRATAFSLIMALYGMAPPDQDTVQMTNKFIDAEITLGHPGFEGLSVDSLGKEHFPLVSMFPSDAQPADTYTRGSCVGYRGPRATDSALRRWTIEIRKDEIRLESRWSANDPPEPFVLNADADACHLTLLGLLETNGSVRLPAVLHFPDEGSFQISASSADAAPLGYSATRRNVKITFPPATRQHSHLTYHLNVVTIHPKISGIDSDPRFDGFRRDWLNIFQINPQRHLLSNNSGSDSCGYCYYEYADIAEQTPPLVGRFTALDMVRQTLDAVIAGASVCGTPGYAGVNDHPDDTADTRPSFLIAAEDYIAGSHDKRWLAANYSHLESWADKMLATDTNGNGLIKYPVSGNSNTWPDGRPPLRPSNWWDTIGFGYEDAYANALAYRALMGMEQIAQQAGHAGDQTRYQLATEKLKAAYFETFYDPATGVLAGWRSADGQLHDYYFPWVNGIAIHYGLVPADKANGIMDRLLAKMQEVGYTNYALGLPGNLIPVARKDYAHHDLRFGGGMNKDGSDGFQIYENGGATACFAYFTLAALYDLGRIQDGDRILFPMLDAFAKGDFQGFGSNQMSKDWKTWNGEPHGYEGLLNDNYYALLAVLDREKALNSAHR